MLIMCANDSADEWNSISFTNRWFPRNHFLLLVSKWNRMLHISLHGRFAASRSWLMTLRRKRWRENPWKHAGNSACLPSYKKLKTDAKLTKLKTHQRLTHKRAVELKRDDLENENLFSETRENYEMFDWKQFPYQLGEITRRRKRVPTWATKSVELFNVSWRFLSKTEFKFQWQ